MKGSYIYNNPYLDVYMKIIDGEEFIKHASGKIVSLCTSYFTTETPENLNDFYSNNASSMIMTHDVWQELNDKKSDAFHCGYSTGKYKISKKILKVNSDATNFPELLHKESDGSLHFFMIDTHINNGSSGSPVFLKDTGKVIGIASGRISSKITAPDGKIFDIPANMGICIPAKYAINFK